MPSFSRLFFQGSHVFSIFNLRIHAYNKNKITRFWHWQSKYLTALLSKFVPYGDHNFKDNCEIKLKIIEKTNPVNTLRPRDSFCFLLGSSHFFYPNFKRPIPAQKWILKQQVRVPLNIPKHSTKISCQCTNPFRHLVRATPKTTRKPFRGHGRVRRPRPPWPRQRSAARPRRRGLQNAAPSSLGRRGYDAEGGAAAAAVEKQGV